MELVFSATDWSLIFSLLQQMSVFLVIAYLFSKTPFFRPLVNIAVSPIQKLALFVVFSSFCIMGTYFGLEIQDAIANTRAVGAVLGGLLGGPVVGFFVGLVGGMHRYFMGGFTDVACAISTTSEGFLAGLVSYYYIRQKKPDLLFHPSLVFTVALLAELMQMSIILLVAKPYEQALSLVQNIALPMILANSAGSTLFMLMIRDQKNMIDRLSASSSTKALHIAERTVGVMVDGMTQKAAHSIAKILYEETGVAAVAISDCNNIMAFIGKGSDHHIPGRPLSSPQTLRAIAKNQVVYSDGLIEQFTCSITPRCPLGSTLVIPLQGADNQVVGTIKLYESKHQLFRNINKSLGQGIARLLSNQILFGHYEQQKNLLTKAELKLTRAQINPHFLFNALNTIGAVTAIDAEKARGLLNHLSLFFRKNLKRNNDISTLKDELDHVDSYLVIEKARFGDKLTIKIDIEPAYYSIPMPTFTLQPLVENAIKHGISNLLDPGTLSISLKRQEDCLTLTVADNAGCYSGREGDGLGMKLVDKRLKNFFGENFGLTISCEPEQWTKVSIGLPLNENSL